MGPLTPAHWHDADSNHWRCQREHDSQFLGPLNPSPSDQRSSLWQLYKQIPLEYLSPWLAYTSTEKVKRKNGILQGPLAEWFFEGEGLFTTHSLEILVWNTKPPVVQSLDNTIQQLNHCSLDKYYMAHWLIQRMVFYPMCSAIALWTPPITQVFRAWIVLACLWA